MSAYHDLRQRHPHARLEVIRKLKLGAHEMPALAKATRLDEGATALALVQLEQRGQVRRKGSLWELVA